VRVCVCVSGARGRTPTFERSDLRAKYLVETEWWGADVVICVERGAD